jgi:hypothetical protein
VTIISFDRSPFSRKPKNKNRGGVACKILLVHFAKKNRKRIKKCWKRKSKSKTYLNVGNAL